ncbi:hypothetical protein COI63_33210, partial [Bacillus toyonensis]|uniref:insecticidal delta-endotoxin Cry8Ea1 family protein n=1 Tax=Bacillus toyonensis TaxID=155322 RepID=UPI000C0384CC
MANQYQNEFEILDANPSKDPIANGALRYPLATSPESELQNMNYKDWMDMCAVGNSTGESLSTKDAVVTSINITSYLLSVGFPAAGAAFGILGALLGFLWPTNTQEIWQKFMNAVEELVDQKIETFARNQAIARLAGIHGVLKDYQGAVNDLNKDPNNPLLQEITRTQFIAAETFITGSMPLFQVVGQEVPMLTIFTEAANLHLPLLRDGVTFGASWGVPVETRNRYQLELEENLSKYTDYCVNIYNIGLQQAHKLPPNYDYRSGKIPWIPPNLSNSSYSREIPYWNPVIDWNLYNNYRRDMTLMVLDVVALWPMYNPKLYSKPVKSELTRELYSELIGQNNMEDQNAIENMIVRPPHLFTWLDTMKFGFQSPKPNPGNQRQYRDIQVVLHKTNDNNSWEETTVSCYGTRTSETVLNNAAYGRVELSGAFSPCMLRFYTPYNGGGYLVGNDVPNVTADTPHAGGGNLVNYGTARWYIGTEIPYSSLPHNHRLSYVDGCSTWFSYPGIGNTFNWVSSFVFAWTHNNVDPNNTIDPNKITQIPAVKGYGLGGNATVIRGPGSTGGDLVQLPNPGSVKIQLPVASKSQSYRVRIRYASSGNGTLRVVKWNHGYYSHAYYNVSTTYSSALTYNSFKYLESYAITMYPADNDLEIWLENSGGGPIIIDKIEFIPIQGTLAEYEADQSLEKARKAVNALFTNDVKNVLQLKITDYEVDQAANLVECVSEEFHAQEKMILLDQVKFAKRLSQSRNLLNYGDFESSDWSGENGWRTSSHVHVAADNPIFKGRYLHMPGAMSPQFSNNIYPTYAYQNEDESKLKS